MRIIGHLCAKSLKLVEEMIVPGVSTLHLNDAVEDFMSSRGAVSGAHGYMGYPKHICTSVNEVICHGIPSRQQVLREGDIVNVDVAYGLDGFYGDTSRTFVVGEHTDPLRQKVVEVCHESLAIAMTKVKWGARLNDLGKAIEAYAISEGCCPAVEFAGHGIGCQMHEAEIEVNHFDMGVKGLKLYSGYTFTIEPMINLGLDNMESHILADGWTAVTQDGTPSAQFEHTIAVTEDGLEVLTALDENDTLVQRARELGASVFVRDVPK